MNRRNALKSLLAIPAVNAVEVARLTPGDTVVITYQGAISEKNAQNLGEYAKEAFPPGTRIIVLSDGATISVVRPTL